MHRNHDLYDFLLKNSLHLTEDWYNTLADDDPNSVYSTTHPEIIKELKAQNQDYFLHVFKVFIEPEDYLYTEFKQWSEDLAEDQKHLETPLQNVVREYLKCQDIVIEYVKKFYTLREDQLQLNDVFTWIDIVIKAANISVNVYIESYHKNTIKKLQAQKQMITELSSPIIELQNHIAMLPLVGDIDTARAKVILESTLSQCSQKGIQHLCIDLSGVAIIDTMVAHQIFDLVRTLTLIGVESTISGIRPEIAQTAIQLGLPFNSIKTTSSIAQTLKSLDVLSI